MSWTGSESARKRQRYIESRGKGPAQARYRDPIKPTKCDDASKAAANKRGMCIAAGTTCSVKRVGRPDSEWQIFVTTKYLRFDRFHSLEGRMAIFRQGQWLIRVERALMMGNPRRIKDKAMKSRR